MTLRGVYTVFRKELADHFSSYRFVILFGLITMVSLIIVYMAGIGLRSSLEGARQPTFVFLMLFTSTGAIFSLAQFVGFFGPLIGLMMGFDAINRERTSGTLSKLVSQPIYRDAIINGKFLAGVATIAIMLAAIVLLISGLGLLVLSVVPGVEELVRLVFYWIISVFGLSSDMGQFGNQRWHERLIALQRGLEFVCLALGQAEEQIAVESRVDLVSAAFPYHQRRNGFALLVKSHGIVELKTEVKQLLAFSGTR